MTQDSIITSHYTNSLNRIFNLLLIALAGVFPYFHKTTSLIIILLIVVWLLNGGHKKISKALKDKSVLLFILLFIIPLLSLVYSDNKELSVLEKRLPLIIFPILLYDSRLNKETIWLILYSFAAGCLIMSLYSFTCAIRKPELFGTEMTLYTIGISHVYFGLYLSFTIIFLIYFLLTKERHNYTSLIIGVLLIYLIFFLVLLGGKMSIISLFLLASTACVRFIIKTKRWIIGALLILLPIIIFFITINHFDQIKNRFYSLFDQDNYQVGDNQWNNIGSRITILKCTFEIFKENPIIGTGIGDVQNELDACNINSEFQTLVGMNPHNQYLQFLLGSGIIGMSYFLIMLLYSLWTAYKGGNHFYLYFLFLFGLCCFTESLLERQIGAIFYSFFNSLLFFNVKKDDEKFIINA